MIAEEFGKIQFAELREHLHDFKRADGKTAALSRATITERLRVVRNAFDWAATTDVIEGANVPGITTALRALSKLKKRATASSSAGRCRATSSTRRCPTCRHL